MSDTSRALRIGEVARLSETSVRMLRYYDEHGLLVPARDTNGYRVYDPTAVVIAANIKLMLRVGLGVADVRDSLDHGCLHEPLTALPLCSGTVSAAERRLAALDERIATLLEIRARLADQVRQAGPALMAQGVTESDSVPA